MIHHDPPWSHDDPSSLTPKKQQQKPLKFWIEKKKKRKTADPSVLAAWRLLKGSTGLTASARCTAKSGFSSLPFECRDSFLQTRWFNLNWDSKKNLGEFFYVQKLGKNRRLSHVALYWLDAFTTIILPMASPSSAGIHKLKEAGELIGLTCHLCLVGMVCDEKDATRSGRTSIHMYTAHIYIYIHCVYIHC